MTRTAVTFTPDPYADTSLSPVASRFATNAVRRSMNHPSATEPIVSSAPGIQPIDCASGSDQFGVADTGDLEMVIDRPTKTNSTPVDATTGCSRTTATSTPVTAPITAAVPRRIGMAAYHSPKPEGRRTAMNRQLMKVASGPTETSIPPERIDGVDANPTSTKGASVASVAGSRSGDRKLGLTNRFTMSSAIASTRANAQEWRRRRPRNLFTRHSPCFDRNRRRPLTPL